MVADVTLLYDALNGLVAPCAGAVAVTAVELAGWDVALRVTDVVPNPEVGAARCALGRSVGAVLWAREG